ncbi:MAG: glycosyl transferase family 90 [Marinomonas sp.]
MSKKDLAYVKQRFAKIRYYLGEGFTLLRPVKDVDSILADVVITDEMRKRVDYYCKLNASFQASVESQSVGNFKKAKSFVYFADLKKVVRHFSKENRFDYRFGDIVNVPEVPAFLKSRPIDSDNAYSVLLKLNAVRHYAFYEDPYSFDDKKPLAVWRGANHQKARKEFVRMYHESSFADIGHSNEKRSNDIGFKGFLSVQEQLAYKYVVSIEGHDVATNLKWLMASNSLCMMKKPRFETWFMEGTLKAGVHYVELAEDFSDLEEKVNYYNHHPEEAKWIIKNANAYVTPFLDHRQEKIISLLVAQKYFSLQG